MPWWAVHVGQWLYDWQTLIAGVLAILAAGITAWLLWQQIGQADRFNREQIERAHNAARLVLPLALSDIVDKCQEIANALIMEIDHCTGPNALAAELLREHAAHRRLPSIQMSSHVLAAIQKFIETLTVAKGIRHTAELISSLQILLSRYRSFDLAGVAVEETAYSLLLDAAKVRRLAEAVFNYARFVDSSSFSIVGSRPDAEAWDMILRSAYGLIFHVTQIDRLAQPLGARVNRYKSQGSSPWNEKFEE